MTTDKARAEAERLAHRWAKGLVADFVPSWVIAEIEALIARDAEAEGLRAQLAEARKYGAPVAGSEPLAHVKNPCTKHNAYWTTASGACMACRADEAEAKLARVEANVARWQHEAEGLREDAAVGRMIRELLRLWPKPTEVYISPLRKDPRDETRPKDPDAFQVELNWGDSYTAYQSDTLAGAAKAALDAAGNTNKETL